MTWKEQATKWERKESLLHLHYMVKRSHLPKIKGRQGKVYYAFDNMEHFDVFLEWIEEDVELFDRLWDEGKTLDELSEALGRNTTEVTLLAADRAIKGKIEGRKGGIFGG
jgi:hypothetical protein